MKKLWILARSLFAWNYVGTKGVWAYYENELTKSRRAKRISFLFGPRDFDWLNHTVDKFNRVEMHSNENGKTIKIWH